MLASLLPGIFPIGYNIGTGMLWAVLVNASTMFAPSASALIASAAKLHKEGLKMNMIDEMIPMLRPFFGMAGMVVFVIGMPGAVPDSRPVFLMLMSQAGISIVMPLALLGLMWLSARPETTGVPAPRQIEWLLLGLTAVFPQVMGWLSLRGLITDLQQLIS